MTRIINHPTYYVIQYKGKDEWLGTGLKEYESLPQARRRLRKLRKGDKTQYRLVQQTKTIVIVENEVFDVEISLPTT